MKPPCAPTFALAISACVANLAACTPGGIQVSHTPNPRKLDTKQESKAENPQLPDPALPKSNASSTVNGLAHMLRLDRFKSQYARYFGKGNDLTTKIVDNTGNGNSNLYGTRNFRVVLHGVFYRGGANNAYHRETPRDNMNPLPQDGLKNLCEDSFGEAIYLYEKNFVPQTVSCTSRTGSPNTLKYSQVSVLNSPINGSPTQSYNSSQDTVASGFEVRAVLERIYKCATGVGSCPIYAHCWNGWHASGLISAVALMQFCDFSPDQAVQYWTDATDSPSNSNYPTLKNSIRSFIAIPAYKVSHEIQDKICPQNPYRAR